MRSVSVQPVQNGADLKKFIRYPYQKYRGHPYWVPPPLLDQKMMFNRRRHPFYRQAEGEFFLAADRSRVCGRIAAIHNHAHNDYHGEQTGFFGFFECDDTPEVAKALLDAATEWCAGRGLKTVQGPMNPSTNYECGMLVEGFDHPPVFMMTYNPPAYPQLLESNGFAKAKDLLAFWLKRHDMPWERLQRLAERISRQEGLVSRPIRMNQLVDELDKIFTVYNNAWSKNWGFVPMSRAELDAMAASLKLVCDPRIILIMEKRGEPVGFLLAMPDLNLIFKDLEGRLLPFGWWRLLRKKNRLGIMRVLAMGFNRELQNLGYAAVIYRDIMTHGAAAGYDTAEVGWVLEDNVMMNRAAEMLGAEVYKRYRIYERAL